MERKNITLVVQVGIFFVLGMLVLIFFSLRAREVKIVRGGYELLAFFDDGKGLEKGSMVTVSGIEAGKVRAVELDSERARVKVTMLMRPEFQIPYDSTARILFRSLLGQYYVDIKYGSPVRRKLEPGEEVPTQEAVNLNQLAEVLSDTTQELKSMVSSFHENQERVLRDFSEILEENRDNISSATKGFAEAAPRLVHFADDVQDLFSSLKKGEGTLGKLLVEDELYNDLRQVVADARDIGDEIKQGEGSLSQLVYSDELHQQVSTSFDDFREVAQLLRDILEKQQDNLDSVFSGLGEHMPQLTATIDNLYEVSQQVRQGEGPLGRLINDPSLYDDTQRTVNRIEETFKETEEQGLMRTFAVILFAGLL